MYKIEGRLNMTVDLMAGNGKLKKKCEKQMKYYRDADRFGFRDLTKDQLAEVEAFWKPYEFIYKVDPVVHRFYTNASGRFDPGYIPEDLQKYHMSKYFMDSGYTVAFKDKNYTEMLLDNILAPKSLVHKIAGVFRDEQFKPITVDQAVEIILSQKDIVDTDKIAVIKPTVGTSMGSGLEPIDRTTTAGELRSILMTWRENLVAQAVIVQHPELAKINASSVNSIRVMSLLLDDQCCIISACLRVGQEGSFVDNWGKGGLSCGIDGNGSCTGPFYDKKGKAFKTNPNGFNPEGFQVPGYQKMIEAVKVNHLKFPQLRLISWDFAISPDGQPVFIEWNMKGDSQLHQLSNGPLYGERTKEVLDEFFGHAYMELEKNGVKYREYMDHIEVAGCTSKTTNAEIEAEINGKPVTAIAGKAFEKNIDLISVSMPDTVIEVKHEAFSGCRSLKTIKLSKNLQIIGEEAFSNCRKIDDFGLMHKVRHINTKGFQNCVALKNVAFGEELGIVEYEAFSGCKHLKSFVTGNNKTEIQGSAFKGCQSLK